MASRKDLKSDINNLLGDVIEECYDYSLSTGKNEEQVEAIVDEVVNLADDLIARVNSAKTIKDAKKIKAHFNAIREELGDKTIGFIERLNAL